MHVTRAYGRDGELASRRTLGRGGRYAGLRAASMRAIGAVAGLRMRVLGRENLSVLARAYT